MYIPPSPIHNPAFLLQEGIAEQNYLNVQAALFCGALPNLPFSTGESPLYAASALGNRKIVLLLLENKADIDSAHIKHGWTPLHIACFKGHMNVVSTLIAQKASIALKTDSLKTALYLATQSRNIGSCEVLIKAKADVNEVDHVHLTTPLLTACNTGFAPLVELFLEAKADPNVSLEGETALLASISNSQIVQLLLQHKAFVTTPYYAPHPSAGDLPLHEAARLGGNHESVKCLLKYKADPMAKNKQGQTAIELLLQDIKTSLEHPFAGPEIMHEVVVRLDATKKVLEEVTKKSTLERVSTK